MLNAAIVTTGTVLLAALLAATPAAAQSRRAGTSEVYIGPIFTESRSYSFEGGATARTNTGNGINFGFAYNIDPHFQAGMDIAWVEQQYSATVPPGPLNPNGPVGINGYLESQTIRFNGTWHLLRHNFTPFLTGGLGWTYIDTNIPTGLPQNLCWYYPWYGQYCASYVPTATTTKFSYNAGIGLRLDVGKGVFRLMANSQSVDYGHGYGGNIIQYRIDLGTKF